MRKISIIAVAVLLAGCVDSPSQPAADIDQNPLASSFEGLAQDQLKANDVERSEEFRWAALALRAGVTPSVLEVTNNGKPELYDAFVHAVTWNSVTLAMRPPTHRSLIAWRRSGDLLQIILVGMATDSAPVLHPWSMRPNMPGGGPLSPIAGAMAAYFERGSSNSSWVGIGGHAKIAERPQPTACPTATDPARPAGVTCLLTRFGVRLNILFAQTRNRDSRDVDAANAVTRRIIAPDQVVAGVKLVFNCMSPAGNGCP